jgi:hypothetical protein
MSPAQHQQIHINRDSGFRILTKPKDNIMKIKNIGIVPLCLGLSLVVSGCTITDVTSSTSGTLDTVTPDVSLNHFVDTRIASIQKEAAQGEGENLDALADLMGKQDKKAFSQWMHENYADLFNNLSEPTELVSRIRQTNSNMI